MALGRRCHSPMTVDGARFLANSIACFCTAADLSLWLTDGFGAAVGSDWGQRMAPESFNLDDLAWMSIHEFGHGLGYPDYYNWDQWTDVVQPVSIMSYTPTGRETEWDAAFTRYVWDRLKERLL